MTSTSISNFQFNSVPFDSDNYKTKAEKTPPRTHQSFSEKHTSGLPETFLYLFII